MAGFDDAWLAISGTAHGGAPSPELRSLLRGVYLEVLRKPHNLVELQDGLSALFVYLSGPGRTEANCWATDLFFGLSDGWEQDWGEQNLPDDFHDVLAMAGEALHDTVKDPKIAENFGCLPEQLLERVRQLRTGDGV